VRPTYDLNITLGLSAPAKPAFNTPVPLSMTTGWFPMASLNASAISKINVAELFLVYLQLRYLFLKLNQIITNIYFPPLCAYPAPPAATYFRGSFFTSFCFREEAKKPCVL
jgi:hypothetical protein